MDHAEKETWLVEPLFFIIQGVEPNDIELRDYGLVIQPPSPKKRCPHDSFLSVSIYIQYLLDLLWFKQ